MGKHPEAPRVPAVATTQKLSVPMALYFFAEYIPSEVFALITIKRRMFSDPIHETTFRVLKQGYMEDGCQKTKTDTNVEEIKSVEMYR